MQKQSEFLNINMILVQTLNVGKSDMRNILTALKMLPVVLMVYNATDHVTACWPKLREHYEYHTKSQANY